MSRNLDDVMAAVREILPAEHHARWDWLRNGFAYKPPEAEGECWGMAQHFLFGWVGIGEGFEPPLKVRLGEEWKAKALALWSGQPVDRMQAGGLLALP